MENQNPKAKSLARLLLVAACTFLALSSTASAQVISNVAATYLTDSSAIITWMTDIPASSLVNYGVTTSYGYSSALDPTLVTAHSVTLTGLSPGTRYVFEVVSASAAGVSTLGADLSGLTIWAWGDSQTGGGNDGTGVNYPTSLSADLGGVPVNNEGVGGNTSTQIAQRMLATPASFAQGNCHVIWAGSNNPTQTSQILSDVASMVSALSAPKCFLVLSVINQVVSPLGSSIYNSIIFVNNRLASARPFSNRSSRASAAERPYRRANTPRRASIRETLTCTSTALCRFPAATPPRDGRW